MAVNNYAPAEYGGYVLRVNGSGDGGDGGDEDMILKITATYDSGREIFILDKTWQEIFDVVSVGGIGVITLITDNSDTGYTSMTYTCGKVDEIGYFESESDPSSNEYTVVTQQLGSYYCTSRNAYPTAS